MFIFLVVNHALSDITVITRKVVIMLHIAYDITFGYLTNMPFELILKELIVF